jgi:P-type Cu2+ transporter
MSATLIPPAAANSHVTAASRPPCAHCGAPLLDGRMKESGFCCAGCAYVFRLVHEHGLAGYYRIKDEITAPADAAVFQPRDYSWLEAAQREAEAGTTAPQRSDQNKISRLTLDVQGISCVGCVWLIERIFQPQAGARDIVVNAQYGTMQLRWTSGQFSAVDFARKLQAFGYLVGPAGRDPAEPESRGLVKRIGLCAAFTMNVMLFAFPTYFGMEPTFEYARLFGLLALLFGTLSFLVGGTYFLHRAVRALRERAMHIDLPIALGIVGAYTGSLYGWIASEERYIYFDFVASFILLMLIGRWAQIAAVERNRRRLLRHQPVPPQVRLIDGPAIAPEQLRAGQKLRLASGQTLPVESRLESGEATFSLASINGEADPRIFRLGQRVPAGAVNIGRAEPELTTLQAWSESLLAQLLGPGDRASERHLWLEKIVRGYVVGILAVAALAGLAWWLATGDGLRSGAVVTAVLVVSCPCAVALAFPLADEIATIGARRCGVFVREGDLWPRLARVRQFAFDKTGTLTLETPLLQNPAALAALDAEARAALHALVCNSPHPLSQCLLEQLLATGSVGGGEGEVRESVGFGVELGPWSLGRAGWRDATPDPGRTPREPCEKLPGTVFARAGEVLARFYFRDTTRPDAVSEVSALRKRGYKIQILSGDEPAKVTRLANELGLPANCAQGSLTPGEKAAWLAEHGARETLMLGDGANDSLAFDQALCRGTPVIHRGMLERKADFYYLGRGIGGLRALFEIDAIRRRTQRRILVFSVAYNLLAVGLAVAGRMNPLVAAIFMPVNSLLTLALVTIGMRPALVRPLHGP